MANKPPLRKDAPAHFPLAPIQPTGRISSLLGTLAAVWLAGIWCFPSGAYPLESITLCVVMAGAGLLLALESVRKRNGETVARMAGPIPWLMAALALYALLRWRLTPVPALGREWAGNLLWMPSLFLTGFAFTNCEGKAGPEKVLMAFRRAVAAAAIGFALLAIYQKFIGYPQAAVELREHLRGPARDLMNQSLLYALDQGRAAGRMGNPNLFAAQLCIPAIFCIGATRDPAGKIWRGLGWAGLLLSGAGVALSGSRGGALTFLAAAASAGWIAWKMPPRSRDGGEAGGGSSSSIAKLAAGAAGVAIALASGKAMAAGFDLLERIGRIDTIRERLFYWEIAAKVWRRNFLFGEGPGSFERLYPLLKSPLARESQYAHSWIFQYGAELGLLGLVLLGLLWLAAASRLKLAVASRNREAVWPLLALLVLAFNGLFEFSLQWREFIAAAGLLAGLACGSLAAQSPAGFSFARRASSWSLFALLALCIGLAAAIGQPLALAMEAKWEGDIAMEDNEPGEALRAYLAAAGHEPDSPQLWLAVSGAMLRADSPGQAYATIQKAKALNPESASIRAAESSWLERSGNREAALASMDEAVARYPSKVGYRLERARLALELGRADAAREDLQAIESQQMPIWELEREPYNALRLKTGLQPIRFE